MKLYRELDNGYYVYTSLIRKARSDRSADSLRCATSRWSSAARGNPSEPLATGDGYPRDTTGDENSKVG